jgi:hypothetical protein
LRRGRAKSACTSNVIIGEGRSKDPSWHAKACHPRLAFVGKEGVDARPSPSMT